MVTMKHSHDDHHHHPDHDQVVLDEVYKSKKEKSADTLSAESEETQVVFLGKAFQKKLRCLNAHLCNLCE